MDGFSSKRLRTFIRRTAFFCGACGSPPGLEASHYPGAMQIYAASLVNPATFTPEFHLNHESRLAWLKMEDDLPKFEGTLLQRSDAADLLD